MYIRCPNNMKSNWYSMLKRVPNKLKIKSYLHACKNALLNNCKRSMSQWQNYNNKS